MKAKLGMSPIAWWNDDLPQLSDDVSLEECLRQSRSAGFTGMEKGRRFPESAAEMLPILKKADVTLCGGWFSGTIVNESIEANKQRIQPMIDLFKAVDAPCIVYGEVGRSIQGDQSKPLATKPKLSDAEMKDYGKKMSEFATWVEAQGMPLVYHHHMGTVVQTEAELDRLLAAVPTLFLLLDPGHLAFAGIDPVAVAAAIAVVAAAGARRQRRELAIDRITRNDHTVHRSTRCVAPHHQRLGLQRLAAGAIRCNEVRLRPIQDRVFIALILQREGHTRGCGIEAEVQVVLLYRQRIALGMTLKGHAISHLVQGRAAREACSDEGKNEEACRA